MRAYFHTLGCKVNQYETQALRTLLGAHGYESADFEVGMPDVGDAVIVINSCTVTGESDRKLRQLLRRLRRDHPQATLVLTGCFPQAFPDVATRLPEPNVLLGNAARRELPAHLERWFATRERILDIPAHTREYEPLSICDFAERTRAFVKIEDGCDRFCSYCIIPYARGRVRSRSLADLKDEVTALAAAGYREIVLVGINLTAYGKDTGDTLAEAVRVAASPDGICRVRLGSLEPDYLTDEVITALAQCEKLCPQFHVALQSGCDATLKRMRRRYTTDEYRHVCRALRDAFPHCAITTDMMVGFPGETEEEFATSLAFAREIAFSRIHCFAYSRRAGTPAATAPDQVSNAEKARRSKALMAVGDETRRAYERALVGTTVEVLTETPHPDGTFDGYTATYVPVRVPATAPGTVVTTTITAYQNDVCIGE